MTANPEKGEVAVVIEGVSYVLVMTFNSMIALQQMFKADGKLPAMEALMLRAQDGDLEVFRAMFWATLQRHHQHVTVEEAGRLIDDVGGIVKLNEMLDQVIGAGQPDVRDIEALGGAARPPKAARATRRRGGMAAALN